MNKHRWLSVCLIALLSGLSGLAVVRAQQSPPQKSKQDDKKTAGEKQDPQIIPGGITINVSLPITVMDSKTGRFITDLKQADFQILEDKVPQSILNFTSISLEDTPVDVAVLLDTSNSAKPKLKFEKDSAISFLQTVLRPRKDRALFVTFDSQVELHQDFTDRIDLLSRAIDKVVARGETRMYDAIYQVCEEKMVNTAGKRNAMVILTDGEDTISERTLGEAINIALKSNTIIFVISTKAGGFFGVQMGTVDSKEDKDLKKLAEDTGGRAFFTSAVIELEKSFTTVARELHSQYLVAYSPSNEKYDGKFREIEVRLPGRKDVKVRTRKGYIALPPR